MDLIERAIHVSWRHRVFFADGIFDPANPALRDVLRDGGDDGLQRRALVVLDQALATARPGPDRPPLRGRTGLSCSLSLSTTTRGGLSADGGTPDRALPQLRRTRHQGRGLPRPR